MIWVDYVILGLIVVSAVIGLFRGFVREVFSVAIWVVAIWVGLTFNGALSTYLEPLVSLPSARLAASFAILFFITLILGSFIGYLLGQLVAKTGISGSDRFAGLIFGIARGMLVVALLVLLAGLTPFPEDPWWSESRLIEPFQALAIWLRDNIPSGLTGKVVYR